MKWSIVLIVFGTALAFGSALSLHPWQAGVALGAVCVGCGAARLA